MIGEYIGHFYCPREKKFVNPAQGEFHHPHEGIKDCLICPKCGGMVFMKKQVIGGHYAI